MKIYYNKPTRRNSIGTKTWPDKKIKPTPTPTPPVPGNGNGTSGEYDLNLIEVPGIALTIPLLGKILEFAREECKCDRDIHALLERLIEVGLNEFLDIENYYDIFGEDQGSDSYTE